MQVSDSIGQLPAVRGGRRATRWGVALGLLLLLFCVVPMDGHGVWGSWERVFGEETFWDGSATARMEALLPKQSRTGAALRTVAAGSRLLLFRDLDPPMVLGTDGVIFEGRYLVKRAPREIEDRAVGTAARIAILNRRLSDLGVRLIIAAVPIKGWVLEHALKDPSVTDEAQYRVLVQELEARGVAVVDLLAAMRSLPKSPTPYWRTDTHWSCVGAIKAAEAVTAAAGLLVPPDARVGRLLETGMLRDAGNGFDKIGYQSPPLATGESGWTGILERFGYLRKEPIYEVVNDDLEPLPLQDLNGNGASPAYLFGTSFTEASGFVPALHHFSGGQIYVRSRAGAGALGLWQDVLEQGFERIPRVLIWEWPLYEPYAESGMLRPLDDVLNRLPQFDVWQPLNTQASWNLVEESDRSRAWDWSGGGIHVDAPGILGVGLSDRGGGENGWIHVTQADGVRLRLRIQPAESMRVLELPLVSPKDILRITAMGTFAQKRNDHFPLTIYWRPQTKEELQSRGLGEWESKESARHLDFLEVRAGGSVGSWLIRLRSVETPGVEKVVLGDAREGGLMALCDLSPFAGARIQVHIEGLNSPVQVRMHRGVR